MIPCMSVTFHDFHVHSPSTQILEASRRSIDADVSFTLLLQWFYAFYTQINLKFI